VPSDTAPSLQNVSQSLTSPSSSSAVTTPHQDLAAPFGSVPEAVGPQSTLDDAFLSDPDLFINDDVRWEAVLNRNPLANGHFFYCVKSTSIFCRPTCPSRRPERHKVEFVLSIEEAQQKGYRACKRCKPEESADPVLKRQMDVVEQLKKELLRQNDESGNKVTVTRIAQDMGVSMWHLNRLFKRVVGTSPKVWAQEQLALRESKPT
jgi:AraC family transcriptional regulator of adaptative response/methylated-DNA-[protein]-cysteine methyltransferase